MKNRMEDYNVPSSPRSGSSLTDFNFIYNLQKMVLELISGPCIGMEIIACDSLIESRSKSHCDFRNLCGPSDPVSIYFYKASSSC